MGKSVIKYLLIVYSVFLGLIVFIPNLFIKWMLIDDGHTIAVSKSINSSLVHVDLRQLGGIVFENSGRFRPFYWLSNYVVWLIGGNNAFVFRLAHVTIWLTIIYFMYRIILHITNSNILPFIVLPIYLTLLINRENILRLGPQEPLVVVMLMAGTWFLVKLKRNSVLPAVFFLLALLVKETSLAIIPGMFYLYLMKKNLKINKTNFKIVLSVIVVGSIILITNYLLRHQDGYSSSYQLTFRTLIINLRNNLDILFNSSGVIIFSTFLIYVVNRSWRVVKNARFVWVNFLLILFISFVLVQLPWEFVLARYLTPSFTFLILAFSIELKIFYEKLVSRNILRKLLVGLFLLYFVYTTVTGIVVIYQNTKKLVLETKSIDKLTTYISKNANFKERVWINMTKNESTEEYVSEIGTHLDVFKNRADLNVSYLIDPLPENKAIVVDINLGQQMFTSEFLAKIYLGKEATEETITGTVPVFTTFVHLPGQIANKSFKLIQNKESFNLEGLYTKYVYHAKWVVYEL